MRLKVLALLLGCALPSAAPAQWEAALEPRVAPPGTVVICRLKGRAPEGLTLAGFQQEAGFYISGGGAVALLAVPLGTAPGGHTLTLGFPGGRSQALAVEVGPDPYPKTVVASVPGLKRKLAAGRAAQERETIIEARADSPGPPQWRGPFRWPLIPPVKPTSLFGSQRSYNNGQAAWRHRGLDLRAAVGTPVLAPADGTVLLARQDMAVTGGTVLLGHGYGVTSAYYHLSRVDVGVGWALRAGQALGLSGASGLASGPHLHWEILLRGHAVEPRQWLDAALLQPAPVAP